MVKKPKISRTGDDFAVRHGPRPAVSAGRMPGVLRLDKPGALLICRILEEGGRRGLTKEELGQESLGVQRSYFSGLCAGDRDVPSLGEDAITKAARFLGIARVTAKLLAGQLTDADFFAGPGTYQDTLRPALRMILDDPEFVPPLSILSADAELQSFIVHLYERATQRKLIAGKLTQHDIIKQHRALQGQEGSVEMSEGATAYDRVLRACRKLGITLRSPRLRDGAVVDALGLATHGSTWSTESTSKTFDVAATVETFAAELKLLDSVNPQPELFHTGVVAAALLSLSLDPSTLKFFSRLSTTRGKDSAGSISSPIRKLRALISKVKKREAQWTSIVGARELCSMTLQAVDAWKRSEQSALDREASGASASERLERTVQRVRARKAMRAATAE